MRQLRELRERHLLAPVSAEDELDAADYAHVDSETMIIMASMHERMGQPRLARRMFELAAAAAVTAGPHGTATSQSLRSESIEIEVERLTRQMAADEERERRATLISACNAPVADRTHVSSGLAPVVAAPRLVDRVHHAQLTYAQFVERYVSKRRPVVLTGLQEVMFGSTRTPIGRSSTDDSPEPALADDGMPVSAPPASSATWTFSSLLPHVSHLESVPLKYSNRHSQSWAKLEERGSKSMTDVLQEMAAQRQREIDDDAERVTVEGGTQKEKSAEASSVSLTSPHPSSTGPLSPSPPPPSYYVHDYSLPLSAPSLLSHFTIPRFFASDLFQLLSPGSMFRDSWPSLFVGARGSKSDLHVDTLATHFWMAMMGDGEARKKWILFDPEDLPMMYPRFDKYQSIDPTFDVTPYQAEVGTPLPTDAFFSAQHARYPLFARAAPRITILRSGEALFVPHGTPHYVENLSTTLSISCNFLLDDNLPHFRIDAELMSRCDPGGRLAQVVAQIDHGEAWRQWWRTRREATKQEKERRSDGVHQATGTDSVPIESTAQLRADATMVSPLPRDAAPADLPYPLFHQSIIAVPRASTRTASSLVAPSSSVVSSERPRKLKKFF